MNPSTSWIGGRSFDLFFFFGSSALAVLTGALILLEPRLLLPLWILWLWFLEGPHLLATWARTYFDPEQREKRRFLLWSSLAFFLPGFLALILFRISGNRIPFDLFLGFAALWSYHHAVRQNYGILCIYQRFASTPQQLRQLDAWFLYFTLWSAFGLFILAHPENRRIVGLPTTLAPLGQAIVVIISGLLMLFILTYVGSVIVRSLHGISVRPSLFVLFSALGTMLFAFFVIGPFEPLVKNPQTPEQMFMAVAVVGGVLHGLQYLGIVIAASGRRFRSRNDHTFAGLLGRRPLKGYACFVLISLVYLALNAARGAPPVGAFFTEASGPGQFFLALYWGLFFHHYYLDQNIWRVGKDVHLQYELGLKPLTMKEPS